MFSSKSKQNILKRWRRRFVRFDENDVFYAHTRIYNHYWLRGCCCCRCGCWNFCCCRFNSRIQNCLIAYNRRKTPNLDEKREKYFQGSSFDHLRVVHHNRHSKICIAYFVTAIIISRSVNKTRKIKTKWYCFTWL